jgi:diguanylate cyclase (GGDEF)-like protein
MGAEAVTAVTEAPAQGELGRLEVRVEAMRAVLVRLLQDVVQAEKRLARADADRLVEVNEQLVVTALAGQADALAHTAALDALTQLPGRAALTDRFASAAALARRHGSRLALMFIDLDNFKRLNDSFGHAFGDALRRSVAARLRASVREVDFISRHGGDEFVVLLTEVEAPRDALAVAEKLGTAIAVPEVIDGRTVGVTASIGIAIFPDDGDDLETLMRRADAAMYDSKRRTAGGVTFHGGALAPPIADRKAQPARRSVTPSSETSTKSSAETSTESSAESSAAAVGLAGVGGDPAYDLTLPREANERLVLAALTAQDLRLAAEHAQQRQAAFLAAVADELRNPQAPIRIASAMVGRPGLEQPLLPQVQGIVEQQLTRIAQLVGGLVDLPQTESASLGSAGGVVDLAQIVTACLAAHAPLLALRRQHLDWQAGAAPVLVQGDAGHLAQIVGNLIDNASKHTHDGGAITLTLSQQGSEVTLEMADNGIGISPQMLPHVFDAFVQDTHALGFNGVGLGIGLTIARADACARRRAGGVQPGHRARQPLRRHAATGAGRRQRMSTTVAAPISAMAGSAGAAGPTRTGTRTAHAPVVDARDNGLLAGLPEAELARWLPSLEPVVLSQGQVLFESGATLSHGWFPTTAIVSLLYLTEGGGSTEIAVVGREGFVGTPIYMGGGSTPSRAVVRGAGLGLRIGSAALRQAFEQSPALLLVLLRYTQALIAQLAQIAVCNRHHSLDQQLCRWLLLTLDRLPGLEIAATQELMAQMLGVRREGVTEAAGAMQRAGIIQYGRGRIVVKDRTALEHRSCECHAVISNEYRRLLP